MLISLISRREINVNFSIRDTVMSALIITRDESQRQPNCKSMPSGGLSGGSHMHVNDHDSQIIHTGGEKVWL